MPPTKKQTATKLQTQAKPVPTSSNAPLTAEQLQPKPKEAETLPPSLTARGGDDNRTSSLRQKIQERGRKVFSFFGDLKAVIEFLAILYSAFALATQLEKNSLVAFFTNVFFSNFWVNLLFLLGISIFLAFSVWQIREWLDTPHR